MAETKPSQKYNKISLFYSGTCITSLTFFLISMALYYYQLSVGLILLLNAIYTSIALIFVFLIFQKKNKILQEKHQKELSILRHDVKGFLSPALLMADRISLNKSIDKKITQSAEAIAQSIERVANYLQETKK